MLSTVAMIRLGYVKGNRMTNVKPANEKLRERSLRILMSETKLDETAASELMRLAGDDLRVAIVINRTRVDADTARAGLEQNGFVIEAATAAITARTTNA